MAKFQDKERNLNVAREKQEVTYKGAPIRLAADFSKEMLQARREWQEILQVMKTRGLQPIKMGGQIRSFLDKRSLKEYTSSKPEENGKNIPSNENQRPATKAPLPSRLSR